MKDIMIDIETLGTASNSCVLSVAAVKFDLESGKTGGTFYMKVDLLSCLLAGLEVDSNTIEWWKKQDNLAIQELTKDTEQLSIVLTNLNSFIDNKDYKIWANSPSFDCVILKNCYNKLSLKTPWGFWNERDVRTLSDLDNNESKHSIKLEGVAHNALDDCYHQIAYCSAVYSKLF